MPEVVGVWRSPVRGADMEPLRRTRVLEGHGLENCAHARPRGKRQVLFVAAEDLEDVGAEPGLIRENFTLTGADLMSWPIGQRLLVGSAEFEVTMVCDPCERMNELRPGLQAKLEGRRGMLARVTKSGDVSLGDEVVRLPGDEV